MDQLADKAAMKDKDAQLVKDDLRHVEEDLRSPKHLNELLLGRVLAADVADPTTGEIAYERNELLSKRTLQRLLSPLPGRRSTPTELKVRSVLGLPRRARWGLPVLLRPLLGRQRSGGHR